MKEKGKKRDQADLFIEEEILREGSRLEEAAGPVTFRESPDFDFDESFARLCEKIEAREQRQKEIENELRRQETAPGKTASPGGKNGREKRRSGGAHPVIKAAVACLVLVVGVFAFSMTSEANRMWWMESIERVVGRSSSTVINNDENRVRFDTTESDAAAEIKEKTGIDVPRFMTRPNELHFDTYEYNQEIGFAFMYYKLGEQVITMYMKGADKDISSDFSYDGNVMDSDEIQTVFGKVSVKEIKSEDDEKSTAVAEWNYHNCYYRILGKIDMDSLKSMLENIYF